MFTKATKKRARARVALCGPSSSGKTYTGLVIATTLADGKPVAVIDSESGSASKYADLFSFDVCELTEFSPQMYIAAIHDAEKAGYGAILIDSLSHAWMGKGGALEMVDKAAARSKSGNSFTAWRDVTPIHLQMIDTMLQSPCHIIATMRSKTEYVIEEDGRGKKTPRKIGMAPVQRDGMEYEFDIVGDLDPENNKLVVTKSRCPALSGEVIVKPDAAFAKKILDWVSDGVEVSEPAKPEFKPAEPPKKKTPEEMIRECKTPAALADLLKGWALKKPVGQDPTSWAKIIDAAEEYQAKRLSNGDWQEADASVSGDEITARFNELALIKDAKELFSA